MIENFLRPPRGVADVLADALRAVGVLAVLLAAVLGEATDAGVLAFALPGLFAARFLGLRAGADIALCASLLLAAGSNVFDLYTRIAWWDLFVHFLATGLLAVLCYILLAVAGIVPDPRGPGFRPRSGIVLTALVGLALGALWEMVEWFGDAYLSDEIFISYDDTIGDLTLGGLGALAAGFAVAYLPLIRTTSPVPAVVRPPSGARR